MLSLLISLILALSAQAQGPAQFQELAPGLFRSALAINDADYEFYRTHGINTIIDLREGPDTALERETAQRLGFRYVNIPLNLHSTTSDYVRAERDFFRTVDGTSGVVFHCKHGKDRTGLMAALYRVERQGWTSTQAIEEWKSFGGFGPDWGAKIKGYFTARVRLVHPLICSDLFRS